MKHYCEACAALFDGDDGLLCPACLDGVEPALLTNRYVKEVAGAHAKRRQKRAEKHRPHTATLADRHALLLEQGGRCAICQVQPRLSDALVVDHNHATGETRGLLCSSCNTGIGHLGDHPEILRAALRYLTDRGFYGSYPKEPGLTGTPGGSRSPRAEPSWS